MVISPCVSASGNRLRFALSKHVMPFSQAFTFLQVHFVCVLTCTTFLTRSHTRTCVCMQAAKAELDIDEFQLAQTSLEQVFIKVASDPDTEIAPPLQRSPAQQQTRRA